MEKSVLMAAEGGYSVIFASFLRESIGHIIPWLIVTACVILCDLVVGLRKSIMMGEEVRFSSACRRTLGKTVSYFMFVIMVAVIDVAANGGETIDKWACLLVCFIEGCSIINNILKPKGLSLDIKKLIEIIIGKKLDINLDGVVKEDKKNG
jgi:phage-related holin